MINFSKIDVHVRKPVDHLVTTSARRLVEPRLRIRFRRIRSLCLVCLCAGVSDLFKLHSNVYFLASNYD